MEIFSQHAIFNHLASFKKSMIPTLTFQQKKIIWISFLAFSITAACFFSIGTISKILKNLNIRNLRKPETQSKEIHRNISPLAKHECEIVFVRHGNTFYNKGAWNNNVGNWNIPAYAPLNEKGREDILKLKQVLKNHHFASTYASPTTRAIESAQIIINENCPIDLSKKSTLIGTIKIEKDLEEIMMGFEGSDVSITEKDYIKFFKEKTGYPHVTPSSDWIELEGKEPTSTDILCRSWKIVSPNPDAIQPETYEEYGTKLRKTLLKIAANHPGEKILIVGHSTAGKVIKAAIDKKTDSWSIDNQVMPIGASILFKVNFDDQSFSYIENIVALI